MRRIITVDDQEEGEEEKIVTVENNMSNTTLAYDYRRGGPRTTLKITYSGAEGISVKERKMYWGEGVEFTLKGDAEIKGFLFAMKTLLEEKKSL